MRDIRKFLHSKTMRRSTPYYSDHTNLVNAGWPRQAESSELADGGQAQTRAIAKLPGCVTSQLLGPLSCPGAGCVCDPTPPVPRCPACPLHGSLHDSDPGGCPRRGQTSGQVAYRAESFAINPATPNKLISRLILKQLASSDISARTPAKPRNRKWSAPRFRLMWPKGNSTFCLRRL